MCAFVWYVKCIIDIRKRHGKDSFTQNHKLESEIKKQTCLGEIHSGGEDPHRNVVLSKKRKRKKKNSKSVYRYVKDKFQGPDLQGNFSHISLTILLQTVKPHCTACTFYTSELQLYIDIELTVNGYG